MSLLLAVLTVVPAAAQRALPTAFVDASPVRAESKERGSARANEADAVVVESPPNAVRVVAIPVPPELRARGGRFAFVRQSALTVIGQLDGEITTEYGAWPLAVSISVPASAPAGRLTVGVMRFTCANGCEPIEVPVIVDVLARHDLQLEPARALVGWYAGARLRTEVVVRNSGNATEIITLALKLPADWRSQVLFVQPLRVEAGLTVSVPFEIVLPENAGVGDYGILIQATSASGATKAVSLNVLGGAGMRGAFGWRPMLEATAAIAQDGNGTVAPAVGADLSGELMPDVQVTGRASITPHADRLPPLIQRSLGRLGYSSSSTFLTLHAPEWEAGVGTVGISDAGLAGTGLWGTGASGRVMNNRWRGGVLGVQPPSGGRYIVGDASFRTGPTWTGIIVSSLSDDVGTGRSAQTIAADVTLPWRDGALVAEAGRRTTDSTSRFAWLARLDHRSREWGFNAAVSHAPGGTAAFNHAEDEFHVDGFRRVKDWFSLSASAWNSHDGGIAVGSGVGSSGWMFSPQFGLGPLGSVSLDARESRWKGTSVIGSFANLDREARVSWSAVVARIQTRLGVSSGTLQRKTSIAEDLTINAVAPRLALFASAAASTRLGELQLEVSDERTGTGVGIPTRQQTVAARIEQMPFLHGRAHLRAELLGYHLAATNVTVFSEVLGLDVRIAESYLLVIDTERNDFQQSESGRSPWVITTKIRRAIGLPAFGSAALRGVVFEDLNGNGKRDRNERGVPGAVVHIDGAVVTTDAQGRFPMGRSQSHQVDVDPRSLPRGWVVGARPSGERAIDAVALAIVPTAPVEVSLLLTNNAGIDPANVRLERAVIVLTDSAARSWTGSPDAHGTLRFDALPPGVYEIGADLSRVGAPLTLPAPLPVVRVEGGGSLIRVSLQVTPRAVRVDPQQVRPRQIRARASPGGDMRDDDAR
ncbi:MAG TPA: NEW3 domain-containing protein [Gemmatimonadaceae bacterium]|nr:NEW3 domain-containing protein [Gemmatimonadaceae bacterium]